MLIVMPDDGHCQTETLDLYLVDMNKTKLLKMEC